MNHIDNGGWLPRVAKASRYSRLGRCFSAAVPPTLAEQVLERFRRQVPLTYGGHPAFLGLMDAARARRIPVVFHMHNSSLERLNRMANTPDSRDFDRVSRITLVPPPLLIRTGATESPRTRRSPHTV